MRKNTRRTRRMKRRRRRSYKKGGATMQRERPSQAQPLTSTGGPDPNIEEIKRKMKYKEYALTVLHLKNFFEKKSDLTPLKNMLTPVYEDDRLDGQIINLNQGTLSHVHIALTDFKDGKLDRFFDKIPPNSSKNKLFTFFDKKIKESTAELEKSIKNYKPLPTGSRRTPKQQQAYENIQKKSKSLAAAGRRGGKSRKSKRSKRSKRSRKKVKA